MCGLFPSLGKSPAVGGSVLLSEGRRPLFVYTYDHMWRRSCAELLSAVQIRPAVHPLKLSSDSHRTICCDTHIFTAAFSLWGSRYNLAVSTRISLFPNEANRGPSARRQTALTPAANLLNTRSDQRVSRTTLVKIIRGFQNGEKEPVPVRQVQQSREHVVFFPQPRRTIWGWITDSSCLFYFLISLHVVADEHSSEVYEPLKHQFKKVKHAWRSGLEHSGFISSTAPHVSEVRS